MEGLRAVGSDLSTRPSVRVRSNDVLLAVAGVLFVLYPAIRPCSDETVAPGRCGLRLLRLDRRPRTQPKLWRPRVQPGETFSPGLAAKYFDRLEEFVFCSREDIRIRVGPGRSRTAGSGPG